MLLAKGTQLSFLAVCHRIHTALPGVGVSLLQVIQDQLGAHGRLHGATAFGNDAGADLVLLAKSQRAFGADCIQASAQIGQLYPIEAMFHQLADSSAAKVRTADPHHHQQSTLPTDLFCSLLNLLDQLFGLSRKLAPAGHPTVSLKFGMCSLHGSF